ncbi:ABC transporter permease [Halovulum sp. GXIMD14794]
MLQSTLAPAAEPVRPVGNLRLLTRDPVALLAALFLSALLAAALFGAPLLEDVASSTDLRGRNAPPFDLSRSWEFFLGADTLGRPILPRIIVAAQNTLLVAGCSVLAALFIGAALGMVAGYAGGWVSQVLMRGADIIMSFPSLLMAVIVLYMLEPSIFNLVIVLAFTRIPVYLRTTRAEVMELRNRMFVQAAEIMGASPLRIIVTHLLPMVLPTLVTIATMEFAFVVLAESALSFLGIGIQPPSITWGIMVAQGKPYLTQAWWLSFWPGLAIIMTTLSLTLLSNWMRLAFDPSQRWRLEIRGSNDKPSA